jgi:hypothetical protein
MTAPDSEPLAGRYRPDPDGGYSMAGLPRAVDLITGQQVGLKSFSLDGLKPEEITAVREWAGHVARLRHRSVVSVLDVVATETELVLVLQYWPARPADQLIARSGRLAPDRVAQVGSRLADGLVEAHAADIHHHDITPANVWFDDIGWAKLADFGLTRAVEGLRHPGSAPRSVYLAPETSRAGYLPAPADVYGLGATLTALAGATPGRRRGKVAGPLGAVLGAMMQPDPARRLDAVAARDQLAALVEAQPGNPSTRWAPSSATAAPWASGREPGDPAASPGSEPPRPWYTRPSVLVPLAVVLVVALALGGALVARRLDRTEPQSMAQPTPPSTAQAMPPPADNAKDYLPTPARADLCAVRDMADFSGFGEVTKVLGGRYSECAEDITLASGGTAHVSFSIWNPGPIAQAPIEQRGDLTIVSPDRAGSACLRQIEFPTGYHLDVTVTMDSSAAVSPCTIAGIGTDAVVRNVSANGFVPTVPTLGDPNSLRRQDACQLLAPADVAKVPTIDPSARRPLYANWACSWGNDPNAAGFAPPAVVVQFQRVEARNPQDAGTLHEIGGRDVYVRMAKGDNDQGMCLADIVNRVAADPGEPPYAELVVLSVYAHVSATRQCQLSVDLARKLITQLPPP